MGGGGKGGGGGGDSSSEVRFAPYVEGYHADFLATVNAHRVASLAGADAGSPFASYVDLDISPAFFGIGYTLASFPALYDMYGKFMAGLDVEALFSQIFADTVNGTVIDDLVASEGVDLSDDIIATASPRFVTGMRDINSVMSSTFVVGKAMMETARTKALSAFSAKTRYTLVPIAADRWKTHLEWNKGVVMSYAEIIKLYILAKTDEDKVNYEMEAKNHLWPFTVLEYERAALGALQGAQNSKTEVAGASTASRAIGGALVGAAGGAMIGAEIGAIGGPWGAAIGGVLGLASGLL